MFSNLFIFETVGIMGFCQPRLRDSFGFRLVKGQEHYRHAPHDDDFQKASTSHPLSTSCLSHMLMRLNLRMAERSSLLPPLDRRSKASSSDLDLLPCVFDSLLPLDKAILYGVVNDSRRKNGLSHGNLRKNVVPSHRRHTS